MITVFRGRKKEGTVNCNDKYKLVIHQIFLCFLFLQWFLANFSYQEALSDTQVAIVNILSSTSGKKCIFKICIIDGYIFDIFSMCAYMHIFILLFFSSAIVALVFYNYFLIFIILCYSLVLFIFLPILYRIFLITIKFYRLALCIIAVFISHMLSKDLFLDPLAKCNCLFQNLPYERCFILKIESLSKSGR